MHQHFALWFLIDSLNKHEFFVTYSEVLKYEHCAAVHQGTKISGVSESSSAKPTHFMHHVAGNVAGTFTIPRLENVSTEDGLVVKVLDFQSRGPVFKTTGWLQG